MKIKLLDPSVANKIAAGEVVERPSSIVKELVENSIDSGATSVTVEIKGGGIDFIRITDNGCGMAEEDVKNAFLRHATSKISVAEDLNDILTLGFRGEALASIAAVSKISLNTRTKNALEGTQIELTGGAIDRFFPCGCPEGTSITVCDLFFNTPARRKFLKKPSQEASYIQETVNRLALSNPQLSIRFISENKTLLRTPGDNNLLSAIRAVFGQEVSSNMIEVNCTKNDITLTGYIGKREIQRNNKSRQLLFINGRSVKNEIVSSAVSQGYQGRLNIGKFPFYVLELKLEGKLVDVNVHPTKQEVRFADGLPIFDTVASIITDVLNKNQEIPSLFKEEIQKKEQTVFEVESVNVRNIDTPVQFEKEPEKEEPVVSKPAISKEMQEIADFARFLESNGSACVKDSPSSIITGLMTKQKESVEETPLAQEAVQEELSIEYDTSYKICGTLFDTYIIIEAEEDAYLIDQHAAHERLLFERLFASCKDGPSSQMLLIPQIIKLSPQESVFVQELMPQLEEMGFILDDMGYGSIAVKAVPDVLADTNAEIFITSLAQESNSIKILRTQELKRSKLMQMACKSAVKAGDKLTDSDIRKLLTLIATEGIPLSCPHGRPILIRLTKHELEVRFKRVQ